MIGGCSVSVHRAQSLTTQWNDDSTFKQAEWREGTTHVSSHRATMPRAQEYHDTGKQARHHPAQTHTSTKHTVQSIQHTANISKQIVVPLQEPHGVPSTRKKKQHATNAEIQAVVYIAHNTAYNGSRYTQARHGSTQHTGNKTSMMWCTRLEGSIDYPRMECG